MITRSVLEAYAEILSGVGKERIHYLLDQMKPYSCYQDCAEE